MPFRVALESATLSYLAAHFQDGVASVFAKPRSSTSFTVQIVANKYNPSNYWYVRPSRIQPRARDLTLPARCRSGRWRSEYVVDLEASTISDRVLVNVHYYEQGNVRRFPFLYPLLGSLTLLLTPARF